MSLTGPPKRILPEVQSIIGKSNNARAGFEGVKSAFKNVNSIDSAINAANSALAYGNWLAGLFKSNKRGDRFSIDKFLSEVDKWGLARSNRYMVEMGYYSGLKNKTWPSGGEDNKNTGGGTGTAEAPYELEEVVVTAQTYQLLCESLEFPGRSFEFTDAAIYGPAYKMPYSTTFQEINMVFLCNQYLDQKQYFDNWMQYINPVNTYDFGYRDQYTADIVISQLDDRSNKTYSCKLVEAYPIAVQPLSASWQDDQFHKVQVTMSYRYWAPISVPKPEFK